MGGPPGTCVVVPTYNERENIQALVRGIEELGLPGVRMLVVDDSSPDGTADVVRTMSQSRPWVKLMVRERKEGIGSAYRDGFRGAIETTDAAIIVEMDADLQHPPSALPALLRAVEQGADVAIGSRYVPGGGFSEWTWQRKVVSRLANAYSRVLLGLNVKDATSGFRAYAREAAAAVISAPLPAKGFEFQVMSLYQLKGSSRVVEVPYVFAPRAAGESKLRVRDMVRFFFAVARISMSGRPKTAPRDKTEIRGTAADS